MRQFPSNIPSWGECSFTFDPNDRFYDWLVVFHDLPVNVSDKKQGTIENLACSSCNTMHVNYEPSSITTYGTTYLRQFSHILTSHENRYSKHKNRIHHQPGLPWFYGRNFKSGKLIYYNELASMMPRKKDQEISTVCSSKNKNIRIIESVMILQMNCLQ